MAERLNVVRLVNECTALRRLIQEHGVEEKTRRAIRAQLLAVLTDLERRKEARRQTG